MAEAQWFVAHTYSGYENKVKVDIEKTIENRGLQDQILEVTVPMETILEVKNGVEKSSDKKLFPGYVLIHMYMNDETWYVVRNTRGVTGFVGPGSKPVPLTEDELVALGYSGNATKPEARLEVDLKGGGQSIAYCHSHSGSAHSTCKRTDSIVHSCNGGYCVCKKTDIKLFSDSIDNGTYQ